MKQIAKLFDIIANPRKYGINKNARVYKMMCSLAANGVVRTGYSDKNTKYIETAGVLAAVGGAGVACKSYNDAPRGGACGEHVTLTGQVLRDAVAKYADFSAKFQAEHPRASLWDMEGAYITMIRDNYSNK